MKTSKKIASQSTMKIKPQKPLQAVTALWGLFCVQSREVRRRAGGEGKPRGQTQGRGRGQAERGQGILSRCKPMQANARGCKPMQRDASRCKGDQRECKPMQAIKAESAEGAGDGRAVSQAGMQGKAKKRKKHKHWRICRWSGYQSWCFAPMLFCAFGFSLHPCLAFNCPAIPCALCAICL